MDIKESKKEENRLEADKLPFCSLLLKCEAMAIEPGARERMAPIVGFIRKHQLEEKPFTIDVRVLSDMEWTETGNGLQFRFMLQQELDK